MAPKRATYEALVREAENNSETKSYLNWVMNSNMKPVSNWMISRGISWRPSIGRQEMVPSAILARTPSESLDLKGVYRDFFVYIHTYIHT